MAPALRSMLYFAMPCGRIKVSVKIHIRVEAAMAAVKADLISGKQTKSGLHAVRFADKTR